ncbi:MAG TPA: retropepsin-like aspartic protease [Candidatus Tumulicola sp.]|jgi:hypothetical protein
MIAAPFLLAAVLLASVGDGAAPTPLPREVPLFSSTSATPVVLPAVFVGRVLLKAEINGHPVWLHLDTGTSSLVLGAQSAASIGAKVNPVTHYSQPLPVSIGAVRAPTARFLVLPRYGFETRGYHVSGLIGGAFFHANVITIDYPHQVVTFYPPRTYVPPPGIVPMPLDLSANTPVVTATIGSQPGRFLLDTGSDQNELEGTFAKTLRLGFFHGNATTSGVDGDRLEPIFDSPPITLGNVTITHCQVAIANPPRTSQDGILGRNLLSFFSITFDYAHYQAYFVPGPSAIPK